MSQSPMSVLSNLVNKAINSHFPPVINVVPGIKSMIGVSNSFPEDPSKRFLIVGHSNWEENVDTGQKNFVGD